MHATLRSGFSFPDNLSRFLQWIFAVCLVVVLVGCADQTRVIGDLPDPALQTGQRRVVREPVAPPRPAEPPLQPQLGRRLTVVIDPGHGGHDPGTLGINSPLPEKTIVLMISQELAGQLRARGAHVIMTRTGDWFIELSDRARIANQAGADLFVSIHVDAAKNTSATGATVFIARGSSWASQQVANSIDDAFKRSGIETRGVKTAGFKVLVETNLPAVLVECGFLSNYSEMRMLNTPGHRSRVASVIAEGIFNHFGR